jgi:hypothetical protein
MAHIAGSRLPEASFVRAARSCAHEKIVLYCSGGERSQKTLDFAGIKRNLALNAECKHSLPKSPDCGQIAQGKKPQKSCLNSENSSCNPLDICVK